QLRGLLAVAAAAAIYGTSGVYVRWRLPQTPPTIIAAGACTVAALAFAGPALTRLPHSAPSWQVLGSLLALGVLATGIGFYLYYHLLADVGATRATLVTYLIPPLAVGYGV